MPITISGSGTITGLTTGGLPNGIVDTDMLAANAVETAKVADNAISSAKIGTGGIVNVAHVQITASTTFNNNGSHARWASLDSAYTTQHSNSSILVIFNFMISNNTSGNDCSFKLFRKIGSGTASEIYVNPSLVGGSTSAWIPNFRGDDEMKNGAFRPTFVIVDSPSHTAGDVITYEHHVRTESPTQMRLNYGQQTTDARHGTAISTVTFMEIA